MHYDESSKRRNLLTGLVFGTLLGAGLALLLAPGDTVAGKARYVARSARGLGHAGRRTRAYVRALHARVGDASGAGGAVADGDDDVDRYDVRGDAVDRDEVGADDGGDEVARPARVSRMARRRLTL